MELNIDPSIFRTEIHISSSWDQSNKWFKHALLFSFDFNHEEAIACCD